MTTLGPDRLKGVGSHPQETSSRNELEESANAVYRYPSASSESQRQHPSGSSSRSVSANPSSSTLTQLNFEYTRGATYKLPKSMATPLPEYHEPSMYTHYLSVDRSQESSPTFELQQKHRIILCQNVPVEPLLSPKIQKGFFMSWDGAWTCYRRNYFAVELSYTFQPWINGDFLDLVDANGKDRARIHSLAINLSASRNMPLGPSVELIQHTPKRDKGPIMAMEKIYLHPKPPDESYSQYTDERRKWTSLPLANLGPVLPQQDDLRSHSKKIGHTLERLQFKSATANNGKRRAQQQYFFLNVELWANTSSNIDPCWSKVAEVSSAPLVVRGRSPSHYSGNISNSILPTLNRSALRNTSRDGETMKHNVTPGKREKNTIHGIQNAPESLINDMGPILPTKAPAESSMSSSESSMSSQESDDEQLRRIPGTNESQGPEKINNESFPHTCTDLQDSEEDISVHMLTKGSARSPVSLRESECERQRQVLETNESQSEESYFQIYRVVRTLLNAFERFWRPRIASGHVRVSWACRCGKSLYADIEESRAPALVEFVKHAVDPSNASSISMSYSSTSSKTSSSQDPGLSGSDESNDTLDTRITSPSSVATNESNNSDMPLPTDQELYVLLCVNTDVHRIDLAQVDVQPEFSFGTRRMRNDRYLFDKMREEYARLRRSRAAGYFVKPKTIQFIKFELLCRELSGVCVGNFEKDKIPSKSEAIKFGYHFSPCPPFLGDLPVMPHIFMHSFLEPGDHTGSLMLNRIPKKTGAKLLYGDWPGYGWGIYIVEGYNWKLLRLGVMSVLLIVTTFTLLWSILKGDVQGGFGIGQYCAAVLALIVPAYILEQAH